MAYEIGYDIVVDDDKCRSICNEYQNRADKFEEHLEEYLTILGRISTDAISEGDVSKRLADFKEQAEGLKGEAGSIADEAKKQNGAFMTDFDTADNYLY